MSYYLLKYKKENFDALSLVKFESISNSGECYLVSDLKDNYNRIWLMYYDLYKLIGKNEECFKWQYNENYDKIMRELISKL
jgi:hypothetical protein